jgi:hypothetical protein
MKSKLTARAKKLGPTPSGPLCGAPMTLQEELDSLRAQIKGLKAESVPIIKEYDCGGSGSDAASALQDIVERLVTAAETACNAIQYRLDHPHPSLH